MNKCVEKWVEKWPVVIFIKEDTQKMLLFLVEQQKNKLFSCYLLTSEFQTLLDQ